MGKRWTIVIGVGAAGVMALGAQMAAATFPGQDGRISFAREVPKTHSIEIFTARPDGTDVQRLTSNPRRVSFVPDWSPDGEMIAFDSDRVDVDGRKKVVQVYVMNADGSGVTQLTRGGDSTAVQPGRRTAAAWRSRRTGATTRPGRGSGPSPPPTRRRHPGGGQRS